MPERIQEIRTSMESYALHFLRQGREGWDVEHTKAVVFYAEQIALAEGLDAEVLVAAAWLHDIGYYGLFENADATQHSQVMGKKQLHMLNGAKLARAFLQTPEAVAFYTPEQIEKIVHLVEVHDALDKLGENREETVLMEADTLGAIDLERVTPTFDYENGLKYINGLKEKRQPKFQTKLGRQFLADLLPKFVEYFERMKP